MTEPNSRYSNSVSWAVLSTKSRWAEVA